MHYVIIHDNMYFEVNQSVRNRIFLVKSNTKFNDACLKNKKLKNAYVCKGTYV